MTILETIPKYYIPVYSTPIRISTKKGNFIGIYKPIRLVLWKLTVNICIKYQKSFTRMVQHSKPERAGAEYPGPLLEGKRRDRPQAVVGVSRLGE